jgi:acetylornithine deacetylase/succinyl-diaminopimelate desuccinylase-like protein
LRRVAFPLADAPADHPGVRAIAASLEALGQPVESGGFLVVADIVWFVQAGIPAVIFGPASGHGAHGSDERVEIDQLIEGTKALALAIIAWCGVEG